MRRLKPFRTAAGALALGAALACATAACGREGSLERPGPMFGLPRTDIDPAVTRNTTTGATSPTAELDRPFRLAQADTALGARAAEQRGRNTTDDGGHGKREDRTRGPRDGVHTTDPPDDAPVTSRDIRDPSQRLTPLGVSPIKGVPDPLGPPVSTQPPGA